MTGKMTIFTIGFAGKNAERFFGILQAAGVRRVADIRLNNVSQLAGFAKKDDLAFFLRRLAGIEYVCFPQLAPSKDLLDAYRKKQIDWPAYERQFLALLEERRVLETLRGDDLDQACLLCSEDRPDQCHRRLVAEYLQRAWQGTEIHHLQ